jgi:MATE family multidrug resistance protein
MLCTVPVCLLCAGEGANTVLAGVMRGCGRQRIGATINLVTYWLFGLPVACLLAFPGARGGGVLAAVVRGPVGCSALAQPPTLTSADRPAAAAADVLHTGKLGALGLWTGLACTASAQALLMSLTVFRCALFLGQGGCTCLIGVDRSGGGG